MRRVNGVSFSRYSNTCRICIILKRISKYLERFASTYSKQKKASFVFGIIFAVALIISLFAAIPLISSKSVSPLPTSQVLVSTRMPSAIYTPTVVSTPAPTPLPSPVTTPAPTPINIAPNTILYSANWSNGINGWTAPTSREMEWHTVGAMLVSDGTACCNMYYDTGVLTDDDVILAPYSPPVANYAVEAKIQLLPHGNSFAFGLVSRYSSNTGYFGGVVQYDSKSNALITNITQQQPYTPNTSWHTYRLEVKDNQQTLKIDNTTVVQGASNNALNSGHIGLLDLSEQINVSSFTVTAL